MTKPDITQSADIERLVDVFYEKVLAHTTLAPFFGDAVKNWPTHRQRIIQYWMTQLFDAELYITTPVKQHIEVDHLTKYNLSKKHFDDWNILWSSTVDDLFKGPNATNAKHHAINTGIYIYLKTLLKRK